MKDQTAGLRVGSNPECGTAPQRRRTARSRLAKLARLLHCAVTALTLSAAASSAEAQRASWPDKPIRLIIPFAPGGGSDVAGRVAAQCMSGPLGQTVVVDNRAGAGGTIGTEAVIRSPADGYTLTLLTNSSAVLNVFLYKKLSFDIRRDLVAVAEVGRSPAVLTVRKGLASNYAELQAAARRSELTYGSGGNGTAPHLAGTLLAKAIGVEMTHVPFRGSGPALTALISGQVDLILESPSVVLGQVQDGSARALLVAAPERDPLLPEVPTSREAGLANFSIENWYGVFAPAGTPEPVVSTVAKALQTGLQQPGCSARLRELGIRPGSSGPAEFDAYWKAELDRWGPIVANSGASVE
jgi:tripartite-type tricarboxylate transporter receptor subunit TctC